MDDQQPVDGLVHELEDRRKRDMPRKVGYILMALWLGTFATLVVVAWNAYFDEQRKALTLAQQVFIACEEGELGPEYKDSHLNSGLSPEERKVLCKNAQKVIEQNDPELQDSEIQEQEIQDPEIQDPEIQNKDKNDPEKQNTDPDDPEIQDPETQDPEINDPDPNDPITGGSCSYDGRGTIRFTFQTDNGPVTFECTGTQGPKGP